MDTISITKNSLPDITILPNDFIDHHMAKADGEYVKIYLMVLRLAGRDLPIEPDVLADSLELTRKDVMRALHYWEKQGLLSFQKADGQAPAGSRPDTSPALALASRIAADPPGQSQTDQRAAAFPGQSQTDQKPAAFPDRNAAQALPAGSPDQVFSDHTDHLPSPLPVKQIRNAVELQEFISGTDLKRLVFMAETYIGHPLSVQELNSIYYISSDLHFPTDLLEYLVEYCSEKGKRQIRYMEKVAINWYQQGIDTVMKATDQSALYTRNVFSVMKAFGISGRNPGQSEIAYINRWNAMGFDSDIITEACNRTLLTTHQASFPYANRILEGWKKAGVSRLSDIRAIDLEHQAQTQKEAGKEKSRPAKSSPANAFHNFEQRTYDYDDLESRLAERGRRQPCH